MMYRRLFLGLLPLLLTSIVAVTADPAAAQEPDPNAPETEIFEVTITDFRYQDAERGLITTSWTAQSDDGTQLVISTLGGVRSDGVALGVSHEPDFEVGATYQVELVPLDAGPGVAEARSGPPLYRPADGELSVTMVGESQAVGRAEAAADNFALLGWDWNNTLDTAGSVGLVINPNTDDLADEVAIIQRSMARWEDDPQSNMDWTYNGSTSIETPTRDGVNAMFWNGSPEFTSTSSTLARAYYWSSGSNGLEIDIVFNSFKSWVDGAASGAFDLESVATHEVGHGLGLDHAPLLPASMFSSFTSNSTRRPLSLGDQGGLRTLYPAAPPTFADQAFSNGFSPSNPSGQWSYLWNNGGAIGTGSYTPLLWNTFHYDSDGQVGGATNDDFSYGLIADWGVHTGLGAGQAGSTLDRYAVTRFTIDTAGPYSITNSSIADRGCASGGAEVLVLHNNNTINSQIISGSGAFNTNLGTLNPGDTIDVAVGPGANNVCDAYDLDYTITGSSGPVDPPTFADQAFSENVTADAAAQGWTFWWNQNGASPGSGYTQLGWNGSYYSSGGATSLPTADEFSYGRVASWGAHPGRGVNQGAAADRNAIIRYTVSTAAAYSVTNSSFADIGCLGAVDVVVAVNNSTVLTVSGSGSFDTALGLLSSGDTIDVLVSPAGSDGCDATGLDYTLSRTG